MVRAYQKFGVANYSAAKKYSVKPMFCLCCYCDVQAEMLRNYADEIEDGDVTNREGHAAKVYFNTFLEEGRRSESFINGCLNYGYAVLLSAFNREIVAAGYFTQLGIWHDNEFNNFNLASDLMEPFRPYVDRVALGIADGDREFKTKLTDILNYNVKIDGKILRSIWR